jgi:hypothetical protein
MDTMSGKHDNQRVELHFRLLLAGGGHDSRPPVDAACGYLKQLLPSDMPPPAAAVCA